MFDFIIIFPRPAFPSCTHGTSLIHPPVMLCWPSTQCHCSRVLSTYYLGLCLSKDRFEGTTYNTSWSLSSPLYIILSALIPLLWALLLASEWLGEELQENRWPREVDSEPSTRDRDMWRIAGSTWRGKTNFKSITQLITSKNLLYSTELRPDPIEEDTTRPSGTGVQAIIDPRQVGMALVLYL